jgi:Uma2 family endonuclease
MSLSQLIKSKQKWTINDFSLLSPEMNCEIRKGELYMSPATSIKHQNISTKLFEKLLNFRKEGQIFYAPIDVVFSPENVVQPDIVFISNANKNIITENNIQGSPDLLIEIISPSSIKVDRIEKKDLYESYGVLEYCIVDPANQSVEVYTLDNGKYKIYSFAAIQETVESKIILGLKVDLKELFAA